MTINPPPITENRSRVFNRRSKSFLAGYKQFEDDVESMLSSHSDLENQSDIVPVPMLRPVVKSGVVVVSGGGFRMVLLNCIEIDLRISVASGEVAILSFLDTRVNVIAQLFKNGASSGSMPIELSEYTIIDSSGFDTVLEINGVFNL